MSVLDITNSMILLIDKMCVNSGGWCYQEVGLEKLDIVSLAVKVALLVKFSEVKERRQMLIESKGLTEEDCLINAIFGPGDDSVARQLESMGCEMRLMASQYNVIEVEE